MRADRLYNGRRQQDVVAARVAKAEASLRVFMVSLGLNRVRLGPYVVDLVDGVLTIGKLSSPNAKQLRLWRYEPEQIEMLVEDSRGDHTDCDVINT